MHAESTLDFPKQLDYRGKAVGQFIFFYHFLCLLCCCYCFVVLTSQSTVMVMSRWSVNLTTLFLGKLRPKLLTST